MLVGSKSFRIELLYFAVHVDLRVGVYVVWSKIPMYIALIHRYNRVVERKNPHKVERSLGKTHALLHGF